MLSRRSPHPHLSPDPNLPDDTRLWAALQNVGGGTWGGCVYDTDAIIAALQAGSASRGQIVRPEIPRARSRSSARRHRAMARI